MNNNNDNQQLLNWILMSDPTVDLTAPVVPADFVPSNEQQQQQQPGADLFSYFLGNEQQQQQQQQPIYNAPTMPSALSPPPQQQHQATVSLQQQTTPSNVTQQQQPPSNDSTIAPCASPNGKVSNSSKCAVDACAHDDDQGVIGFDAATELTFEKQPERDQHDDEDYLSETQLKMMTSKERRQLRNKISARKFRNRRKEYISMLENEVQKQKQENNRLRLEVTWIRGTVDKLQKENDQLRLQLVLCKEGIQPRRPTTQYIVPSTTAPAQYPPPVANHGRPSSLSPPSLGSTDPAFAHSSDNSTISSHSNPSPGDYNNVDSWDLVLPNDTTTIHHQHQQQPSYHHQTYLSHAVMPEWDLGTILNKASMMTTPSTDLFYHYPLLAPALMSIVLGHTMTMTTQDLVRHAKLLPPPSSVTDTLINDMWFGPHFNSRASKKMATAFLRIVL
ncbi:hypothetical protein K492DRAFT_239257 [Lichtheimia hyalospora FSU 10163]|nr:hypothetical protein K492DRAFT_239257 [Lichtheimia hyalospora FSU 10163]